MLPSSATGKAQGSFARPGRRYALSSPTCAVLPTHTRRMIQKVQALIRQSVPAPPQLPFKESQIPSNGDHKALNRGTLGGLGRAWRWIWFLDQETH